MTARVPAYAKTGVYAICCPEGKQYIGSTTCFAFRWSRHRQLLRKGAHNRLLQEAFNKHGENALVFRKLLYCSRDDLLMYEQIALDSLDSTYNVSKTAGSCLGVKASAETRAKLSAVHLGKRRAPVSAEMIEKMSRARFGKKLSPEHREKIRVANLGRVFPPEHRAKLSAAATGRKLSPEHIEKSAAARRGIPLTEETKRKLSENSPVNRSVRCIETGDVFRSVRDAAKWLNGGEPKRSAVAGICNACAGRLKTTHGYMWEYVDAPADSVKPINDYSGVACC